MDTEHDLAVAESAEHLDKLRPTLRLIGAVECTFAPGFNSSRNYMALPLAIALSPVIWRPPSSGRWPTRSANALANWLAGGWLAAAESYELKPAEAVPGSDEDHLG